MTDSKTTVKPATFTTTDIKDVLLKGNYVSSEDIQKASSWAKVNKSSEKEYLLTQGIITKDLLGQAMAEFYKVPYADLNTKVPSREQVLRIPQDMATSGRVVLFTEDETSITIATDDPLRARSLQSQLQIRFPNKKISLAYSVSEDIDACFIHYRKPLETRFAEIVAGQSKVAPEIIDEIVSDALTFKASDIHFEPQEKEVVVRFRVDGVLHEAGRLAKEVYENILNRIKVQAHLRIDEHFSAQDGAIRFIKDKGLPDDSAFVATSAKEAASAKAGTVDMRVSVIPSLCPNLSKSLPYRHTGNRQDPIYPHSCQSLRQKRV